MQRIQRYVHCGRKNKNTNSCIDDDILTTFLKGLQNGCSNSCPTFSRHFSHAASFLQNGRLRKWYPSGEARLVNYHLMISLTLTCGKQLERIISKNIRIFLEQHMLLHAQQHKFKKGFPTVTQLLLLSHVCLSIIDKRRQVDVLYLSVHKGFYDVNQKN